MATDQSTTTLPTPEVLAAPPSTPAPVRRNRPDRKAGDGATGSTTGKHKQDKKDKKHRKDTQSKKDRKREKAEKKKGARSGESDELSDKQYLKQLKKLHVELVCLQEWVRHKGLKVCVVFEGRDGAGKGGTIKAITERVSPRVFRVIALPAPTEREKSQMYVQRYIRHMPSAGEIVIFDRSWYNRAGVERVMGFAGDELVKRFLDQVPAFEKNMVESGIILLKYWLEVSPEEQTRRLQARIGDGRKVWKLSPMDLKSYGRWYDYSRARDDMFRTSDTPWAPWFVVPSDDKKKARLNCISHLLGSIPYKDVRRDKVKLPKRQKRGGYVEPNYPFKVVPQTF